LFGSLLKWSGISGITFGVLSTAVAVASFFREAGPRNGQSYMIGGINKAALALLLGAMFFTLAGSSLLLVSRPLVKVGRVGRAPRWPRLLAYCLFAYSAMVFGLAVILIRELSGETSGGIIAGLVAYCVMVAVGLLISSWGMKRFADAD
jgi:hypothetical protein